MSADIKTAVIISWVLIAWTLLLLVLTAAGVYVPLDVAMITLLGVVGGIVAVRHRRDWLGEPRPDARAWKRRTQSSRLAPAQPAAFKDAGTRR